MRDLLSKVFIFSILLLVFSCDKWDYPYPLVKTVSVENYNDSTALLKGEITYLGDDEIIDYGYVQSYNGYNFFSCKDVKNEEGTFEININVGLRKGYSIRVAAYAKTSDQVVFGEFINYECVENVLLEIESITPISGDVNTERTIVLKNYYYVYPMYIYINGSYYQEDYMTFIPPNTFKFKMHSNVEPGIYDVQVFNLGAAEYPGGIVVTE